MSSSSRIRLRTLLRRSGYDVVMKQPNLADWLRQRGIPVVLDVGANEGQFARELRDWGYDGRIVSFEPIPDVAATLRQRAAGDPAWEVRECALGREAGAATLHVSDLSVFSSLRETLPSVEAFDARARTVGTVEVEVQRLSDLFGDVVGPGEQAFLKVDTQGSEPDVLDGAAGVLDRIVGVQLELSVRALYEGERLAPDLIGRMAALGYRLAQLRPVVFDPDDDFTSLLQFDAVFARPPA